MENKKPFPVSIGIRFINGKFYVHVAVSEEAAETLGIKPSYDISFSDIKKFIEFIKDTFDKKETKVSVLKTSRNTEELKEIYSALNQGGVNLFGRLTEVFKKDDKPTAKQIAEEDLKARGHKVKQKEEKIKKEKKDKKNKVKKVKAE